MTKKQLLLFRVQYFVYQVTEVITIPLFLLLGIPILLGIRRKRMQNIFDRFEDQISAWGEKLRLYKETGHRYRTVEIRYPIFEDRRPEAIKTLDHYIIPERSLFGKDTIVYFEPFDCP